MNLHRTQFRVIQTAAVGVVSSDTLLISSNTGPAWSAATAVAPFSAGDWSVL